MSMTPTIVQLHSITAWTQLASSGLNASHQYTLFPHWSLRSDSAPWQIQINRQHKPINLSSKDKTSTTHKKALVSSPGHDEECQMALLKHDSDPQKSHPPNGWFWPQRQGQFWSSQTIKSTRQHRSSLSPTSKNTILVGHTKKTSPTARKSREKAFTIH